MDVVYRQKWLQKWCPTTRTNCAVEPLKHWDGCTESMVGTDAGKTTYRQKIAFASILVLDVG
jgi:hypothetical protein